MTPNFSQTTIHTFSLHSIGNKSAEEECLFSAALLDVHPEVEKLLAHYFISAFRAHEFYQLAHETRLDLNEVYSYVSEIFSNPGMLLEQSVNLAKHLYEQSTHPKIKSGEFYTVFFNDCVLDGETVDAVGLFKSENKDTFLKVYPAGEGFQIESEKGVNINKLDKGCLIFNTDKENGYVVAVVDNTNKGIEAQYWTDDFLHIRQRKDEYYNTQNLLSLTKNFIKDELPQQFEISKAEQIDLLNRSVKFFKENESFDMEEFNHEVMEYEDVIEKFTEYKSHYAKEHEVEIADSFAISESAVKKQSRIFKSVIKLDKNFHIYVHGDRNLIEQGEDSKGKFYKVYYQEEN